MKRFISFSSMALAAMFLTGCAVVADPYPIQTTTVIRTSPNVVVYDGWHNGVFYERGRVIRRLPPPSYHRPPPPPPHMHRPPPPPPHMNRHGRDVGPPGYRR